jgi:peptide chain release factor subunit 3
MGKVDSRTIERFEKEAKNRNRESWFLAFIMDTSEEERAKGKTVEVCLIEKRFLITIVEIIV